MAEQLTIAIDYDNTWTAIPTCARRGFIHSLFRFAKVICVTGRLESERDRKEIQSDLNYDLWFDRTIPVLFSGTRPKFLVAQEAGYDVDFWIDDQPGSIMPPEPLRIDPIVFDRDQDDIERLNTLYGNVLGCAPSQDVITQAIIDLQGQLRRATAAIGQMQAKLVAKGV
jgi:hypothetical protein